jgi:hypothetical protein
MMLVLFSQGTSTGCEDPCNNKCPIHTIQRKENYPCVASSNIYVSSFPLISSSMPKLHSIVQHQLDGIAVELESSLHNANHWEKAYENLANLSEDGKLSADQMAQAKELKKSVLVKLSQCLGGDERRAAELVEKYRDTQRKHHEDSKEKYYASAYDAGTSLK